MRLRWSLGYAVIVCMMLSALPVAAQPGQQGNRPGQGSGNRPDNGQGNRPGDGSGNNGGGNRPNPGQGGNQGNRPQQPNRPQQSNRPQPSRPSRPQPSRPGGANRPRPSRPPQWGHRPANRPSYGFRPNDRNILRNYYSSRFGRINRARRPHFVVGGFFPYGYSPYLSPIPPELYGQLPPVPMGYSMGYYDGYVVVYDPLTYFIANVIDLLQ
ncbi:MAG TPA: hypothetical protein VGC07_08560 [Granulicella sp.]